ncbi:helicase-related protein [Specibacter sp. NPDC078709]|uniref:C-terminal helicase domain-containing protein n=1 Tax=Specibacter sp. NPDC078709 TaxID=3154364 RepID=UPI003413CBE9
MTIFSAKQTLAGLKPFQKRTVNHVFKRLYTGSATTDRFLVADETGLGKSVVAAGVVAKAIEYLESVDDVRRIDVVYMCSNADLARQNIDRINVTRQKDIIESGRLTLLPLQLSQLNAPAAENTVKRVNFISLTPGTSFDAGQKLGNAQERAVLFLMLEAIMGEPAAPHSRAPRQFTPEIADKAAELLRGNAGIPGFVYEVSRFRKNHPEGFTKEVRDDFYREAIDRKLMRRFKSLLRSDVPNDDLRVEMPDLIKEFRGVLAEVGLKSLEPDLIILDEFQRFRDLLHGSEEPVGDVDSARPDNSLERAEVYGAAELARNFFRYDGAKLLLLSATPYKAHTSGLDDGGEDHAQEFTELLGFLAQDELGWMDKLRKLLDQRRRQLAGIAPGDNAATLERHLKQFMCRTERPQLDGSDMLSVHHMAPNDVRPADLQSLAVLTRLSRAAGAGNPIEYWKSVPYFANFLGDYQLGKLIEKDVSAEVRDQLPELTTIDRDKHLRFEPLESDNAKYRSVERHMMAGGLWRLLWMPASCPYTQPSGVFAGIGSGATKQLLFSGWQATPNAVSALLSYEAERLIMSAAGTDHENSPEARSKFTPRLAWRMRDGEPTAMSALALFVPHASLAKITDPMLLSKGAAGDEAPSADTLLDLAETSLSPAEGTDRHGDERGVWTAYFGVGKALPTVWKQDVEYAHDAIASATVGETDPDESSPDEDTVSNYMLHVARMLETVAARNGDWRTGVGDLGLNSPANCVYRALGRILPASYDPEDHWLATLHVTTGLRTLFNRPDATTLISQLYPSLDYWQAILRYCADGNLQAVLDEYVFQLRSQQPGGVLVSEQLWEIAETMRSALSIKQVPLRAKDPAIDDSGLAMGMRFAVRYGGGRSDDGSVRTKDVRTAFNSPFWPFVLTSTSVGQEGIDFHWWSHSVIHWNVPGNPVDFEQREGRVHRYMGHAVRKNVAAAHWAAVRSSGAHNPWKALFEWAERDNVSRGSGLAGADLKDFSPYWVFPGEHRIERRLLDHPLSRDVLRTEKMLAGLAGYRLALGQARQDDLLETLRNPDMKPLDLSP